MSRNFAPLMGFTQLPAPPRRRPGRSQTRRQPYKGPTYMVTPAKPRMGAAVRTGRSQTLTRTTTRKKQLQGKVVKSGENSSVSYTNYGKYSQPTKTLAVKLTGHAVREYLSSGTLLGGQGIQGAFNSSLLGLSQLAQLSIDANAGAIDNNQKNIFLKSAKFSLYFKNQSNVMSKVTLYDIITADQPIDSALGSPVNAWNKGYTDMGVTNQYLSIGATPTASPEFKKYFRITKVTRVPLEPGQEHEHKVSKNMNWSVPSTRFENTTSTAIKGLTYWCLVVWQGSLAHESGTPANVTFAPVRLDYVIRQKYSYCFLSNNKPTYVMVDNIPKTILDLDFMGESQDADLDPTNA